MAVLVGQLGEHLREVGGVLLLEQIDEVRRRAYTKETLDGIDDDIEPALRHWAPSRMVRRRALARQGLTAPQLVATSTGGKRRQGENCSMYHENRNSAGP
jgi:hypothetical protein